MNRGIPMWIITDILRPISPICIPFLALFGVVAVIAAFARSKTASDFSNWKKTTGKLVDCHVATQKTNYRTYGMTVGSTEMHQVVINYQYRVDNEVYTGKLFKLGQPSIKVSSRKEGEKISGTFKAAPKLEVYYNPKKPDEAVLSLDHSNAMDAADVVLGIVLIVAAIGLFLYFRPYGF
jgi:hypothetical protein